jgi:hypothetical protein
MTRAFGGTGALAAAVLVLAVLAVAPASSEQTADLVPAAEESILRLHDLPPGYKIFGSCGSWSASKRGHSPFKKWILKNHPAGCTYEYVREFQVPGLGPAPPVVLALTVNTPSEAAAARGLELDLQRRLPVGGVREVGTVVVPDGPTARLYRISDVVVGEGSRLGSVVLWRHGKLIAGVEAGGGTPQANDRHALHFAQIQQRRLEAPSPYLDSEMDDVEVPLDDPALKLPIYWAGNPFQPGGGLPATRLEGTYFYTQPEEAPPGQKLSIDYDQFGLSVWTRKSWKRFQRSIPGLVNLKDPCAKKTEVGLERGRAIVYAGFHDWSYCPDHPPESFWAVAYIGGTVIGVNLSICTECPERGGWGPYNSLEGMTAIVRGLVLRPEPVYAAP